MILRNTLRGWGGKWIFSMLFFSSELIWSLLLRGGHDDNSNDGHVSFSQVACCFGLLLWSSGFALRKGLKQLFFSTLRQKSVGHSQPSQLGDYCEPHGRSKNMRSKSCKDQTKGSNTQNQGTSHFRTVPQTITRGPQVTIWIHLVHSGSKGSHSGTGPLKRWYSLSWAVRISPSLPRPIAGSLGGMYSVLHLFIESHEEASEGRPAASSKCPLPARRQRLPPKWNPSPGAGLVENLWKNIKNWQNSKTNRTSGTNCLIDWVKNRGTELKDYLITFR